MMTTPQSLAAFQQQTDHYRKVATQLITMPSSDGRHREFYVEKLHFDSTSQRVIVEYTLVETMAGDSECESHNTGIPYTDFIALANQLQS